MADGSITFSTALDNEQLEKDLRRTEKEIDSLKRKVEEGKAEESFLKAQMEEARQATEEARQAVQRLRDELGVESDARLAEDLKAANREVSSLTGKLENQQFEQSWIEKMLDRANEKISKTKEELGELRNQRDAMREEPGFDWTSPSSEYKTLETRIELTEKRLMDQYSEVDRLDGKWHETVQRAEVYEEALEKAAQRQGELSDKSARLDEANAALKEQASVQDQLTKKWQGTSEQTEKYARQLERAQGRQKSLAEEYGRTYSKAGAAIGNGVDGASSAVDKFASRIGSMVKKVFVFGLIMKAVRAVKDALSGALGQNERFSASWENLRATITGVANAVANLVAPAITGLVNAATAAISTLAETIDSLFGTNIMQSIQSARDAAQAAWRQADGSEAAQKAIGDQAKATKDLADEQKKATKTILGFDEINAMQAENAEEAADAIGDEADGLGDVGADAGEAGRPDWNALDVGKIDAVLSEIMLILGAALLAVGAILAFSGINIPVGLTLMVIGALLIYTAYKEQWDKLPQEVRDAITAALVITGIVLVVLGAILAFSAVNVPLGIGMMVAGALLLWTAVGLNWNDMPEEIQNVVTVLMGILSVALIVIGAILTFTAANVPLGIALMVAGAVSLAAVAAINWDRMPEDVRNVVSVIMLILGGALLVIGAILALTGVSTPLGIGLMAVGAVILGADVFLNWDYIKDHLDVVLPIIEAALGGALLVIGAVLVFSGAATPLGLGLMAVGAVVLGKTVAENWDRLPDEIKGQIATIEYALGVALLVVGAILAFSMASIPLGIALMAAGAVALGHSVTANWDAIPSEIKGRIVLLESILAPALLAIGAILAFTLVNLPLGIAMMAAGALALCHLATLDWNELPEDVRGTVTTILGIVGAALIVLGVILCFTGVGIPLGIALIAAGAVSLVAAAAINWNFIVDKVKEIWGRIVQFWDSNIAPIFTWQWWANLFKSIVNGLIRMINNGLNAFGGFINNLASGVSSILDFFGVGGYSFRIGMPQIPYLAQGAVIPPNREFMAVLGDQSHGYNIEAPEDLLRRIVREETGPLLADLAVALGNGSQGGRAQDVVLVVGRKELARETIRGIRELGENRELGGSGIVFG